MDQLMNCYMKDVAGNPVHRDDTVNYIIYLSPLPTFQLIRQQMVTLQGIVP